MSVRDITALHKRGGWKTVQLSDVTKMQKSWEWEDMEYRVDVYFGRLLNGSQTPVVIMNVYCQGAGAKQIVDDNCDVWDNFFTSTNKEEGNHYYNYLKKHGFRRV